MARAPVVAAGGIVLRQEKTPLIAVVRLRKRNEWVLPKGKLDDGETPRDAAEREVWEETGHDVSVHEFLDDVRAVDWLPLEAAVERLSRAYERAFLANVGPLALEAAALARSERRSKARKTPVLVKRRRRPTVAPQPTPAISPTMTPPEWMAPATETDLPFMVGSDLVGVQPIETQLFETQAVETQSAEARAADAPLSDCATELEIAPQPVEEISATAAAKPEPENDLALATGRDRHVNLVQIVRDWLWRAA